MDAVEGSSKALRRPTHTKRTPTHRLLRLLDIIKGVMAPDGDEGYLSSFPMHLEHTSSLVLLCCCVKVRGQVQVLGVQGCVFRCGCLLRLWVFMSDHPSLFGVCGFRMSWIAGCLAPFIRCSRFHVRDRSTLNSMIPFLNLI